MRARVGCGALALLLVACRERPVEERRAEVVALCADFCQRRIACVNDGFAGDDIKECQRKCVGDTRPLEDNACGEASLVALECLTAVACEDLSAAVSATAGRRDAACYAELRAQQDDCDLTPLY